jgi:hypothetical protein
MCLIYIIQSVTYIRLRALPPFRSMLGIEEAAPLSGL